ncbi:MAG: prepilin-type N-terminal cleavage/methylation domain-containing protein [Patescibacteria group bacterium]
MRRDGFTIIEVLIYSALLAIFLGATFAFISSILGTTDTLLERNELIANQEFVEQKLSWIVAGATNVVAPIANSSSSRLQISVVSSTLNPSIFTFASATGEIILKTGSMASASITNNRVKVKNFWIQNFSNNQSTSTLKISLSLESSIYPNLVSTSTFFYALSQ